MSLHQLITYHLTVSTYLFFSLLTYRFTAKYDAIVLSKTNSIEQKPTWKANGRSSCQEFLYYIHGTQKSATGFNLEPAKSGPHHPILFL
jgi:hypothetical protein